MRLYTPLRKQVLKKSYKKPEVGHLYRVSPVLELSSDMILYPFHTILGEIAAADSHVNPRSRI